MLAFLAAITFILSIATTSADTGVLLQNSFSTDFGAQEVHRERNQHRDPHERPASVLGTSTLTHTSAQDTETWSPREVYREWWRKQQKQIHPEYQQQQRRAFPTIESEKYCSDFLPKTAVVFDEKAKAVSKPTAALYATVVKTQDHYKKQDLVEDAIALFRSSREVGSKLPMHLIAANLTRHETERFTEIGVTVHNFTDQIELVKQWYSPVYTKEDATRLARPWTSELKNVQSRVDGWATYFKFFVWKAPFDVVLHVDLDSKFTENVDSLVLAAAEEGKAFLTCPYTNSTIPWPLSYYVKGLWSRMFVVQPSQKSFEQLVMKARTGDYVASTQCEQDILECYYPAKGFYPIATGKFDDLCQTIEPQGEKVDLFD